MREPAKTLHDLLISQRDQKPDSAALLEPGEAPLTYSSLAEQAEELGRALRGLGVRSGDPVALIMENGAALAAAFLSVSGFAACAPLNPAYRADELAFFLSSLTPKAIVIDGGLETPARAIAETQSLPLLELHAGSGCGAGRFTFDYASGSDSASLRPSRAHEAALLLYTSGTTSRPKIVSLSHKNLVSSAFNMQRWYQLDPSDRCLSIMPLFHIQGIVGGLLASIAAGASVACMPPFDAGRFFDWLDEFQPTWFTAGPTFHRAILSQADANADSISRSRLRFIRSSSAPLSEATMARLEAVFGVPVLEGYGMTETCLHTTSNPLPPRQRKPGTVGLPAADDVEVTLVDGRGEPVPPGVEGEIVVRGPTVLSAYVASAEVNQDSFFGDWLRTGDQGRFDDDGYLTITGRLKELINRGGEKIAPAEVDAVLLSHPDVVEAATFPIQHRTLGEDVAAAVVLRAASAADDKALRSFLAERLATFKVPGKLLIVDAIPKSHTGKLQRSRLADKLGVTRRRSTRPGSRLERRIAKIWRHLLECKDLGVQDNFFELGGDSLKDVVLFTELESEFGVRLEPDWWWVNEPTIEQLANQIRKLQGSD